MSPLGVWCHLGAQEQACRRSKCVKSVLVSSASSHEVCVREPRAALCPANRRGRAPPVGAAPPHHARFRQPSLPSRPARAKARPAPVHPSFDPACRCAASRRVAVRAPLARGQHHGIEDSRVPSRPLPLYKPCAGTTRRQCRGRRAVCASTAMACQETDEFRPHTTRSASRELVRSLGPPGVAAVGLRYSFESVHAHESITVHQHASVESIILCSGCNMSACTVCKVCVRRNILVSGPPRHCAWGPPACPSPPPRGGGARERRAARARREATLSVRREEREVATKVGYFGV